MPKQSSEMATTAKGSGGSQIGTTAHIERPEDRCNHRCDCHTKKDSKGQIWLPAPGYAPQNQERRKTGYLQQCCHD